MPNWKKKKKEQGIYFVISPYILEIDRFYAT